MLQAVQGKARSIPDGQDLRNLFPVVLPVEAVPDWPGPIDQIGATPFAVTWAVCPSENTFAYVNEHQAIDWGDQKINWRKRAFQNLSDRTRPAPFSGEKLRNDGRPFLLALGHDDAMGPSRLLLPRLFESILGTDYRVVVPEQTIALAYRSDLTGPETAELDAIVSACHQQGKEPMDTQDFEAKAFWSVADDCGFTA